MTNEHPTDRGRPKDQSSPAPSDDGQRTDHPDRERRDPGAYVGREPERQEVTIPGGISPADERVAAHLTQSGPTSGATVPDGHRDEDQVREAGQSR